MWIDDATDVSDIEQQEYIDLRDLDVLVHRLKEEVDKFENPDEEGEESDVEEIDEDQYRDNLEMLAVLKELLTDLGGDPNLLSENGFDKRSDHIGVTLVNETSWEDCARVYADDLGVQDGWPYMFIDWEAAAASLRHGCLEVKVRDATFIVK